ncbi:MAG: calcium/sodium antiporter [Patescibacteria group bacterium]
MWLNIFLFIIGFIFLIKGADLLVDGSSAIAKKFKISNLVIGLTIVSFGTSAPELLVNIMASFKGSADIAIGNIIGSNIANLLLILGLAAVIYPLKVKHGTTWKEIPLSLLAIIVVGLLLNDQLIDKIDPSMLSRIDGFVLLLFFIIFLYYTFGIAKVEGQDNEQIKHEPVIKSLIMISIGILGLYLGGQWIVNGAVFFAIKFGLSEALIGLTIIAVGTSLPELAASAMAAYKHNADIAVGNVVGSNIFNLFWILGISSIINPIIFNVVLNTDIMILIIGTVMLFSFMFIGTKHLMNRWQGSLFIVGYFVYIVFLIIRG